MDENEFQPEYSSEIEIKEQLYLLYLEIKEKLTNKKVELDKDEFNSIVNTIKFNTLINYIKELTFIIISNKLPYKEEAIPTVTQSNFNNNSNKTEEYSQLENHIKKLEFDLKHYIQRDFQNKMQRDTLEMKLGAYMEMEAEFEDLRDKVKYERGKFLDNDRKDNEIIILRQENSILKKEIVNFEETTKQYEDKISSFQDIIHELREQIETLSKKLSDLEVGKESPNNNSSINININNSGNISSKWIFNRENEEKVSLNTVRANRTERKTKNSLKKTFNKHPCNLNSTTRTTGYTCTKGFSGLQTKINKIYSKGETSIDTNDAFTSTYSRILNNLNMKYNKIKNKKETTKRPRKKNKSVSMSEDYDKSLFEKKVLLKKSPNYKPNKKNTYASGSFNKFMGIISNSKFPLSNKEQKDKKTTNPLIKKYLLKDKSSANISSFDIMKKNNRYKKLLGI